MEKKRPTNKVDKKMFDGVKILLAGGATIEQVSEYFPIGRTTIRRIKSAQNWEEYKQILAAIAAENNKKNSRSDISSDDDAKQKPAAHNVTEHRQSVTVQTTFYVSQKLDKIVELLTGISAKMACIIDDLYGPKKEEETK